MIVQIKKADPTFPTLIFYILIPYYWETMQKKLLRRKNRTRLNLSFSINHLSVVCSFLQMSRRSIDVIIS